jgi:hypothetical protein
MYTIYLVSQIIMVACVMDITQPLLRIESITNGKIGMIGTTKELHYLKCNLFCI